MSNLYLENNTKSFNLDFLNSFFTFHNLSIPKWEVGKTYTQKEIHNLGIKGLRGNWKINAYG